MINKIIATFARKSGTINGVFALWQEAPDGTRVAIFHNIPATSGQRGHTNTDWEVGKSPIPKGKHFLLLKQEVLQMEPKGTPFFRICTTPAFPRLIQSKDGSVRTDVGLHLENKNPGTAGCIALLHDTPERGAQAKNVFKYLKELGKTWPYIPIEVISVVNSAH